MRLHHGEIKVENRMKGVAEIEVKLVAENFSGTVNFTDIMLQGGLNATNWTGHPSEQRWNGDE